MRIDQLRLIAYGPFTDTALDLSCGKEGLHLVYGQNEAGKSSALRALRHLLYGIPERSTDNFLHPYGKMRIGAVIRSARGDTLECIRRKGRDNTLRAANDKTLLEEGALQVFLHGVDADLFTTMFGIGYEDLVRGGREIIQGGGNVGRLVFAAASGISNLREVQNELQTAANALFLPSGRNPKINQALIRLNEERQALQHAQLPGQEWFLHDDALRTAQAKKKSLEAELESRQGERHRLERIRQALPAIARRRELHETLATVASAVLLPEDFEKRRIEHTTKLRVALADRDQAVHTLETIKQQAADLHPAGELIVHADLIEGIYRDLGSQYKATTDRVQLETRRNVLRGEAKEILRNLRSDLSIDHAEQLRMKKTDTVRIQELGAQYERIVTRMENARKDIPRLQRTMDDLEKKWAGLPCSRDVEPLKVAIDLAAETAALENHFRNEASQINSALQKLTTELGRQVLWPGTVEGLATLPVPSLESIGVFEEQAIKLELEANRLASDICGVEEALYRIEKRLEEELQLAGEIPSEETLRETRGKRNAGWRLIYNTLEGREPSQEETQGFIAIFPPAVALADAYVRSVEQADDAADRLRREADRVAAMANLHTEKTALTNRMVRLKATLDETNRHLEAVAKEWAVLWEPACIAPRTPKEMRAWAQEHKGLAARAMEILDRQAKQKELEAQLDAHRKGLNECLQALSPPSLAGYETLAMLMKRAKKIIEQEEELRRRRELLVTEKGKREQEIAEARLRVQECEQELSRWREQWQAAVRPLGLDDQAVPSQANAVMEDVKALFDKLKEAETLDKRIYGIDRDANEFTQNVGRLIENVAKDLNGAQAQKAALELHARLTKARKIQSELQSLTTQRDREENRLDKSARVITEMETELRAMCETAGCRHHDDLPEAERRSTKKRQMESELQSIDDRLRQLSAGATVDDFIREALALDSDAMDGRIAQLNEAINCLSVEKSNIEQTIGREQNELSKMDGGAQAAELAESIQIILGGLENDIEQYARLRIASRVLGEAIDRYRDKTQGPVLKKASALFRQITGGSFEGIRAEFDEKGEPVLVGIRSGAHENVAVEGMSDGSADQLYLALRLAGLEEYLKKNEPIPFIVDDILIKFDDDRAVAALQALADLSAATQVLFFTHHRHLVELAEKHIPADIIVRHTLNA